MGRAVPTATAEAGEDTGEADLYLHIAARPRTIADLIAFAEAVPEGQMITSLLTLAQSVVADYRNDTRPKARRRRLIILGVLIARLIFDIENLPRDPSSFV